MPELTLTTRTELSYLAGGAAGPLVADVSISRFAARLASPGAADAALPAGCAGALIEGQIPGAHRACARSSRQPRSAP